MASEASPAATKKTRNSAPPKTCLLQLKICKRFIIHVRLENETKMKIKVVQFGLGPIGIETLKLAASKPWIDVVGGIDIDPAKIGKDLSELTGERKLRGKKAYASIADLLRHKKPDI